MMLLASVVAAWLVLLIFVGTLAASDAATDEDTFVEWAEGRSVILDPTDWPQADADALQPIIDGIDDVRFVFLGEPDHYIAEKYAYRLILIKALFDRGYRHIGMEMGVSDAMRVDRYLETGEERYLDRVALYGYRGDMRTDRDDSPMVVEALSGQPFHEVFVQAERRFLRQLRELNESLEPGEERLRWFGWDIDAFHPGGGYADAQELLGQHADTPVVAPVVAEIAARLERVPGETMREEIERLESALAFLAASSAEVEDALGQADAVLLRHVIRNLVDSLSFGELAFREPFGQFWSEAVHDRESALIERLDDGWLTRLDPAAKVILLGHNMHLGKDPSTLASGPVEGDAVGMWPTVGSEVAAREPVYAMWMLYDHGTSISPFSSEPVIEVPSDPSRIEHTLARVAPVLALPLGDADPAARWLDKDRNFVQNGDYASGRIRQQADAIFFVAEVNALTRP